MKPFQKNFPHSTCKFLFSISLAVISISIFGWAPHLAAQVPVIKNIQSRPAEEIGISNTDMQHICTAAIATLFDQPTAAIKVDRTERETMHLSASSPADGASWQFTCRLDGNRIFWTREELARQPDKSAGQVTFQLTKDAIEIVVTSPAGAENRRSFPR